MSEGNPRFVDTSKEEVSIRRRRLPHWTAEGGVYFVTFRLSDSLPRPLVDQYRADMERANRLADPVIRARRVLELRRQIENALDRGHGSCPLREPKNAQIVAGCMTYFAGNRYVLYGYAVMPNHCHALLWPMNGHELGQILKSWKGFSSYRIGKGRLWQPESFDHLVRSEAQFIKFLSYIQQNPIQAGLKDWPWVCTMDPEKAFDPK